MSRTNVEPYEVSKPSRREGDRVTATIEVIVPLNYGDGSMKFSLRYTTWLANDFCYGVDGPHVSTQQDQYLDQEQCAPVLAFLDDTITDNISLVLNYFSFIRKRLEVEGKSPPSLDEFKTMFEADAEFKKILIDCDEDCDE